MTKKEKEPNGCDGLDWRGNGLFGIMVWECQ
jgi:hypothetical protein